MDVLTEPRAEDLRPVAPWLATAVVALAAAGALHLVAAADHVGGSELVVAFFLAVALAQLGTGVWLAVEARAGGRLRPVLLVAVAAGTAGLLVVYLLGHTTALLDGVTGQPASALPAGHGHGGAPAGGDGASAADGLLGPVTVTVQMVLLLAVVALLPARSRRTTVNGITTLGALAWASWLAGSLG